MAFVFGILVSIKSLKDFPKEDMLYDEVACLKLNEDIIDSRQRLSSANVEKCSTMKLSFHDTVYRNV